jgi:hypothetical protein
MLTLTLDFTFFRERFLRYYRGAEPAAAESSERNIPSLPVAALARSGPQQHVAKAMTRLSLVKFDPALSNIKKTARFYVLQSNVPSHSIKSF